MEHQENQLSDVFPAGKIRETRLNELAALIRPDTKPSRRRVPQPCPTLEIGQVRRLDHPLQQVPSMLVLVLRIFTGSTQSNAEWYGPSEPVDDELVWVCPVLGDPSFATPREIIVPPRPRSRRPPFASVVVGDCTTAVPGNRLRANPFTVGKLPLAVTDVASMSDILATRAELREAAEENDCFVGDLEIQKGDHAWFSYGNLATHLNKLTCSLEFFLDEPTSGG